MSKKQRISVAMCTYNGEKYLHQQLESIAAQTRHPDELVVCDDASSDSTPEMVSEFAGSAPFSVRFYQNKVNVRSTKNFEQAISLCSGDLIALCDQDDIWMPEKLEKQEGILSRDQSAGGVFTDATLVDDNSVPIGSSLWESILFSPEEQRRFETGRGAAVLLRQNVVTGATLMFRAALRPFLLPIPAPWVHDGWIAWMLLLHSRLVFDRTPLVRYRLHAGQQIGVETVSRGRSLTLWERLRKGRDEEPAKHRSAALGFRQLERHVLDCGGPGEAALLPAVRQNIRFLEGRGNPSNNRVGDCLWVMRNLKSYVRYEHGLKVFVRDLILRLM